MVSKQTRCKNKIKAILSFLGREISDREVGTYRSKRYMQWLEQLRFQHDSGNEAFKVLIEELNHLRSKIYYSMHQIRALSRQEPYKTDVRNLVTIPGISSLSAMILLTVLMDINKFGSFDKLNGYCGLYPGEHSTGEEIPNTGLTNRQNPVLRELLIENTWIAVRNDPALMMAFKKLSFRMRKNKAIIRIAKKLLSRIWYVLKNKEAYQIGVVISENN
ncbi:MAG: transposase [Deltaproteobacteria bacterium]|nr:transposase [Deltaproteobacteria bacterium]